MSGLDNIQVKFFKVLSLYQVMRFIGCYEIKSLVTRAEVLLFRLSQTSENTVLLHCPVWVRKDCFSIYMKTTLGCSLQSWMSLHC